MNAFIKVLTEWSRIKKQRKRPAAGNSQKWSRSLTGSVAYKSFQLESLSDNSNGVTMLLVSRAGRLGEWSQEERRLYGILKVILSF